MQGATLADEMVRDYGDPGQYDTEESRWVGLYLPNAKRVMASPDKANDLIFHELGGETWSSWGWTPINIGTHNQFSEPVAVGVRGSYSFAPDSDQTDHQVLVVGEHKNPRTGKPLVMEVVDTNFVGSPYYSDSQTPTVFPGGQSSYDRSYIGNPSNFSHSLDSAISNNDFWYHEAARVSGANSDYFGLASYSAGADPSNYDTLKMIREPKTTYYTTIVRGSDWSAWIANPSYVSNAFLTVIHPGPVDSAGDPGNVRFGLPPYLTGNWRFDFSISSDENIAISYYFSVNESPDIVNPNSAGATLSNSLQVSSLATASLEYLGISKVSGSHAFDLYGNRVHLEAIGPDGTDITLDGSVMEDTNGTLKLTNGTLGGNYTSGTSAAYNLNGTFHATRCSTDPDPTRNPC